MSGRARTSAMDSTMMEGASWDLARISVYESRMMARN
jgi:hypothetical protein